MSKWLSSFGFAMVKFGAQRRSGWLLGVGQALSIRAALEDNTLAGMNEAIDDRLGDDRIFEQLRPSSIVDLGRNDHAALIAQSKLAQL